MAQQVRRRTQKTVTYSANNKQAESLSRGMVYRELHLRLRGQLTVTAAANLAANTLAGDELAVLKRIDLIANNTQVVKSFSGRALYWLNYFLYGVPPRNTGQVGDGTTANPSFDTVLVLPLWIPHSIRPMDTALDSAQLSDLKVEVTWGDHTSINASATGFTTAPSLDVASLESFNVQGPFGQWRMFPIEREVTANNPDFQIHLPVGPMYRGFLINTTDAGADDGDILNGFRLVSGSTVFADVDEEFLEGVHYLRSGVDSFADSGNAGLNGTANSRDGWYYYDHVTDGFLSEAIDTLGFSEITLDLDVTKGSGTTKVIVYPSQIIPVRGPQGQG